MKIHFMGKYNNDPQSIPKNEHKRGAVPFKEVADTKEMGRLANRIAFVIMLVLIIVLFLRCGLRRVFSLSFFIGYLLFVLSMFPHELLHAVCFKRDAYIYTDIKHGLLFVTGGEDMSKLHFVGMSMLPNIVFGFIPFTLCMIFPNLSALGVFGALSISAGAGDYYNVINALTQMPPGARTYLYGFNSYWYMPQPQEDAKAKELK